jgi:uncharacterized protein (TIGR02246 family)
VKRKTYCLIAIGALVALMVGSLTSRQPAMIAGGLTSDEQSSTDQAAIKKAGQTFLKAFRDADARALAAQWTQNGEYLGEDGTSIRGRAAIEKAYADLFAKRKSPTEAEVEVTSIRFPSKDTAIEEGYFKVRYGKEATSSKYAVLHVREGGEWLMAVVREWPTEGTSLRDLEWLIGTWQAKHEDTEVRTTYAWWGEKSFIRMDIRIKQKDRTSEGFQMMGTDSSTGQLKSWTFDRGGSFAEGTWSRDGKKWVQDSAAVLDDGSIQTSTHIITPIDKDTFTFQSVNRNVDGEAISDIPPIRVTRVKGN